MMALAAVVLAAGRVVMPLDGSEWTLDGAKVTVPHTWNAIDGADGLGQEWGDSVSTPSYARRKGVYRRSIGAKKYGKRYFVRCLGASQRATVRVNGCEIGRHLGAYTAFAYEATLAMRDRGPNELEIEVDNLVDRNIAPLAADYTVFGGLYRGVELIETDRVCIDTVTDGANGVKLDIDSERGNVTAWVSVDGGTNEVQHFEFPGFELWSPENPKLYSVCVKVAQAGSHDEVTIPFGFRKAEFREDGFYLNGVKRKIRGVNYHQDREGDGWAVSAAQHAKDIALIKQMGADGLRTAHYPHASATYDECDRQGLLVWCEYPNVNSYGTSETFRKNSLTGIREMVTQLRHHPSIVTWSVGNEFSTNSVVRHDWLKRLITDFTAEVRRIDPTRAVGAATCRDYLAEVNMVPDVTGFNFYPGWYRRNADEMKETIDDALSKTPRKTIGVTEYGFGADIDCHESPEVRNRPLWPFHSEEYQAWGHRLNYLTLKNEERVWGTYVWAMFDFGADARREGSHFGRNDKGLVTYDHKTPKDAFYFYKANWNKEPMLHLVGQRMQATTNSAITVMAFCNEDRPVTLKVNGKALESRRPDEVCSVIWEKVALKAGENEIEVTDGIRSRQSKVAFRP